MQPCMRDWRNKSQRLTIENFKKTGKRMKTFSNFLENIQLIHSRTCNQGASELHKHPELIKAELKFKLYDPIITYSQLR